MAATTTVRVRDDTRRALAAMAKRRGQTMPEVIGRLVDDAVAEEIIAEHNRAVSAPGVLEDYLEEHRAWDATLMDGLRDDARPPDEPGRPRR